MHKRPRRCERLGREGKAEPTMRITVKIKRTAEGHTVEITVEPPA